MKDEKVLIFSTHAPRRKYSKSLFQQIKFLEKDNDEIFFLSFNQNIESSAKVLTKISEINIPIIPIDNTEMLKYWEENVKTKKDENWLNVYNNINIETLKDFDVFYVYGGMLSDGFHIARKHAETLNKTFPNNKGPLSWVSISLCYYMWLAILKAHKTFNIPIVEVAHDIDEYSINLIPEEYYNKDLYSLKFGYGDSKLGIERLDAFHYYLNNTESLKHDKIYDFTFGYTIFTKARKDTFERLEKLVYSKFDKSKVNFFVKDKLKKIDNFINREEYLDYIAKSKYTLIIPTYNPEHVSILRIQESLINDCIPLFTNDNNFEMLLESYPEAIDIIKDNLLIEEMDSLPAADILPLLKSIFLDVKYL